MRTHQTKAPLSTNFSSTAVAVVLFFALIAEIGPVRATVITYFNPAVALVLGVTILGEPLRIGAVLGFALILLGSVLATWRRTAGTAEGAAGSGGRAGSVEIEYADLR
jgi:drug/metabolite transporter (DMT)-like permease